MTTRFRALGAVLFLALVLALALLAGLATTHVASASQSLAKVCPPVTLTC